MKFEKIVKTHWKLIQNLIKMTNKCLILIKNHWNLGKTLTEIGENWTEIWKKIVKNHQKLSENLFKNAVWKLGGGIKSKFVRVIIKKWKIKKINGYVRFFCLFYFQPFCSCMRGKFTAEKSDTGNEGLKN